MHITKIVWIVTVVIMVGLSMTHWQELQQQAPALWVPAVLILYFVPTALASMRHHRNQAAIAMTNLFLGWTALGWIIALIWACTDNVADARM